MNVEEKKAYLIKYLEEALKSEPLSLTFSSPKISSARIIVVSKEKLMEPTVLKEIKASELTELEKRVLDAQKQQSINSIAANPAVDIPAELNDTRDENEELSARQQRKAEKLIEKNKKKDEKALNKMRKDIKKRGFETGVLYELNDPADIYDMSNEEITQIEFASVINQDGFYNFEFPADIDDLYKETKGNKTMLIVGGFVFIVVALAVIFINNVMSLF